MEKYSNVPVVAADILAEDSKSPNTVFDVHNNVGSSVVVDVVVTKLLPCEGFKCCGLNSAP